MKRLKADLRIAYWVLPLSIGWLAAGQWQQTDQLRQQTVLLQQIDTDLALINDRMKPPVSIQVSGFSPEAQAVFNEAVRPQRKGK